MTGSFFDGLVSFDVNIFKGQIYINGRRINVRHLT